MKMRGSEVAQFEGVVAMTATEVSVATMRATMSKEVLSEIGGSTTHWQERRGEIVIGTVVQKMNRMPLPSHASGNGRG